MYECTNIFVSIFDFLNFVTATPDKLLTPSSLDSEDEESTPVDILPATNSTTILDHSDIMNNVIPISPAINNNSTNHNKSEHLSPKKEDSACNQPSNEGDISGPIEQWVTQPAKQGVLYKCRITRDRKGMDRGLFPISYLQLERDYGKKVFCLAGNFVLLIVTH